MSLRDKVLRYEQDLKKKGYTVLIGVDEAGRGPLAGPVVAAAVALRTFRFHNRIDDSKRLTAHQRSRAHQEILYKSVCGVGIIRHEDVDRFAIRQATRMAMEKAVAVLLARLARIPQGSAGLPPRRKIHIMVDGNMPICPGLPCTAIIGGDGRSMSIASASIVAKEVRDWIMVGYDRIYPQYGFRRHKGYGTLIHREAIARHGLSAIHRKTFCRSWTTPVRESSASGVKTLP